MAIPPAWTDVWICPCPEGHIQAVGRDSRGRKQYRYHTLWREHRGVLKFRRLLDFAQVLGEAREQVRRDLRRRRVGPEKVLACAVRLLEASLIRIGNEEYARANHSYGLTTLRRSHAAVMGSTIVFRFRGKGGLVRTVSVTDPQIARVVRFCQKLPGRHLFQWSSESQATHRMTSADVNAYLRRITGGDFTAKSFRTWGGSVLALEALAKLPRPETNKEAKASIAKAVRSVAERLGNTPAVCRLYYVHPSIFDAFRAGTLGDHVARAQRMKPVRSLAMFSASERALLSLLHAGVGARAPTRLAA